YPQNGRAMNLLEETVTGDYYDKKGRPRDHTTALYTDILNKKDNVYGESNVLNKDYLNPSGNTIDKNKAQLKLMMFSPGTKIRGIPFIGNKDSIFDKDVAHYYDFKMSVETKNGVDAYLFEAKPKPG